MAFWLTKHTNLLLFEVSRTRIEHTFRLGAGACKVCSLSKTKYGDHNHHSEAWKDCSGQARCSTQDATFVNADARPEAEGE